MSQLTGVASERRRIVTRWIAELQAAVFVDAMRMLYVGASEVARRANSSRYREFEQMSHRHLSDLDHQSERFATDLEPATVARMRVLEPRLRWIIDELSPRLCPPDTAPRYLRHMAETASSLSAFCVESGIESYSETRATIDEIAKGILPSGQSHNLDHAFKSRLRIQSEFLRLFQRSESWPLLTVADDLNQTLALAYFLVDQWILGRLYPPQSKISA